MKGLRGVETVAFPRMMLIGMKVTLRIGLTGILISVPRWNDCTKLLIRLYYRNETRTFDVVPHMKSFPGSTKTFMISSFPLSHSLGTSL